MLLELLSNQLNKNLKSSKAFDKKVEVYEKKILELNEFRTRKLKKEKLRRKKELKKEARKLRITMKMK